jgi:hypothetical protein
MPPRPGIFRRIIQGLDRLLGGGQRPPPSPPPRPPRPPPRLPPRYPPEPPEEPPTTREEPFREIWDDRASDRVITEIHDRTGNSETEIFDDLFTIFYSTVVEEPQDTKLEMWRDYIDAFVNDDPTFTKNDFFAEWDIGPSSFAWEAWRQARGYGRREQ